MRRLWRFQELSPDERVLFIGALLLLPIAKVGLRICGFNRTFRVFARVFSLRPSTLDRRTAERRSKATLKLVATAAAHGVCRANCLPRSLVGFALLRGQGLDAQLRIGARKKAGVFEAHAWIVVGSVAVHGNPADGDQPFVLFTERQRWTKSAAAMEHDRCSCSTTTT